VLESTCPLSLPPANQAALHYSAGLLSDYLSPEWGAHLLASWDMQAPMALAPSMAAQAKRTGDTVIATEPKKPKVRLIYTLNVMTHSCDVLHYNRTSVPYS
jgi:hypothetical protein